MSSAQSLGWRTLRRRRPAAAGPTESAFKEVNKSLPRLLIRLEGTADERARTCLAALSGRTPDLAAARQAAAGTYQALNHGAHGAHTGDPGQLIHGTRALVDKFRSSLP